MLEQWGEFLAISVILFCVGSSACSAHMRLDELEREVRDLRAMLRKMKQGQP